MADHLDFIHVRGLDGGEGELFQGLSGGEVTLNGDVTGGTVNLDVTPLVEALTPLQEIASQTSDPIDLEPIIEALAPLSYLERLSENDLTDIHTDLQGIAERIHDLRHNNQILDLGPLRILSDNGVIEYGNV